VKIAERHRLATSSTRPVDTSANKVSNLLLENDSHAASFTERAPRPEEIQRVPMSLEEYLALPEQPKAEYVDGVAYIMMAPATPRHNKINNKISNALTNNLTNVEVLPQTGLSYGSTYRIPDLMVIAPESMQDEWIIDPPIIVCEVLSPSTRKNDLLNKSREYAALGAQQYWIADPEAKRLEIRFAHDGDWNEELTLVLDESNPELTVQVSTHGVVTLQQSEIFG